MRLKFLSQRASNTESVSLSDVNMLLACSPPCGVKVFILPRLPTGPVNPVAPVRPSAEIKNKNNWNHNNTNNSGGRKLKHKFNYSGWEQTLTTEIPNFDTEGYVLYTQKESELRLDSVSVSNTICVLSFNFYHFLLFWGNT